MQVEDLCKSLGVPPPSQNGGGPPGGFMPPPNVGPPSGQPPMNFEFFQPPQH